MEWSSNRRRVFGIRRRAAFSGGASPRQGCALPLRPGRLKGPGNRSRSAYEAAEESAQAARRVGEKAIYGGDIKFEILRFIATPGD